MSTVVEYLFLLAQQYLGTDSC